MQSVPVLPGPLADGPAAHLVMVEPLDHIAPVELPLANGRCRGGPIVLQVDEFSGPGDRLTFVCVSDQLFDEGQQCRGARCLPLDSYGDPLRLPPSTGERPADLGAPTTVLSDDPPFPMRRLHELTDSFHPLRCLRSLCHQGVCRPQSGAIFGAIFVI